MKKYTIKALILLTILAIAPHASSADWSNWRGPMYDGSANEKNLPTSWSKTENVRWKIPLPGRGSSTPIISKNRIFLTSQSEEDKSLTAICVNRTSGKILWQKKYGTGAIYAGRGDATSPSAVTDGKTVFFMFGTGTLVALSHDGKELWKREIENELGHLTIKFGFGASPIILNNKLYVSIIRGDNANQRPTADNPATRGLLLCLDPATGKTIFSSPRPTTAPDESQESYATPMPFNNNKEIITFGGDCIASHSPETGAELWRWTGYNHRNSKVCRVITSPLIYGSTIIVPRPRHQITYAIDGSVRPKDRSEVLWTYEGGTDATTPLLYQGIIYMLDGDRRKLIALDPKTGKAHYEQSVNADTVYRASPTASDGKIYIISEGGVASCVKAGKQFELLHEVKMGEAVVRSSVAIADGALFIRTAKHLYCIER